MNSYESREKNDLDCSDSDPNSHLECDNGLNWPYTFKAKTLFVTKFCAKIGHC